MANHAFLGGISRTFAQLFVCCNARSVQMSIHRLQSRKLVEIQTMLNEFKDRNSLRSEGLFRSGGNA